MRYLKLCDICSLYRITNRECMHPNAYRIEQQNSTNFFSSQSIHVIFVEYSNRHDDTIWKTALKKRI